MNAYRFCTIEMSKNPSQAIVNPGPSVFHLKQQDSTCGVMDLSIKKNEPKYLLMKLLEYLFQRG